MAHYIIRSFEDTKAALAISSVGDILLFSFDNDSILFRFKVTKTGMRFIPFKPGEKIDDLLPEKAAPAPTKLVTLQ